MIPRGTGWTPATIDPACIGWYECRYFDGDMPGKLWFDGEFWRHGPCGEFAMFANDGDEESNESWRPVLEYGEA